MDPNDFKKAHPGQLHMHSTMLKLLKIFDIAGFGKNPSTFHWRALFNLDLSFIVIADGSDPNTTINEKDTTQRLVRAICEYFGQDKQSNDPKVRQFVPQPESLAFIRQFALNLACSSTYPAKKQLLMYTKSLHGKTNLHRAYDAASEVIGRINPDTFGTSVNKRRTKKTKDETPVKKNSERNLPPVAEKQVCDDDDDDNNNDNQNNNNDQSEYEAVSTSTTSTEEDDGDKKPPAKKNPRKKQKTGDNDVTPLEILSIPEMVDLMVKSVDESSFVVGLQDVGKQVVKDKGRKKHVETVFPEMIKLASTMRKAAWEPITQKQKALPDFLKKKLITRVRDEIVGFLILKRKKVPIKSVFKSVRDTFLAHFPKDNTEMYTLYPEEQELQGLRKLLTNYLETKQVSYDDITNNILNKTCNDAARVVSIMVDEDNRHAVSEWLKNKNNREAQDHGTKPKQGLMEALIKDCFNNTEYVAMEPEDTGGLEWDPPIDPNDVSRLLLPLLFCYKYIKQITLYSVLCSQKGLP
jgi:hypothetical protein